ncbi:MAG TPA: hypothetical protein VG268_09165 [Streptosporangiaceae bacterium]|nr:hypothetical protein [Streptosporangiaceae bacterium]
MTGLQRPPAGVLRSGLRARSERVLVAGDLVGPGPDGLLVRTRGFRPVVVPADPQVQRLAFDLFLDGAAELLQRHRVVRGQRRLLRVDRPLLLRGAVLHVRSPSVTTLCCQGD